MVRLGLLIVGFALISSVSSFGLGQGKGNPYDLSNVTITSTSITATATYHFGLGAGPREIITHLFLNITFDTPFRLRIRITNQDLTRWEVPNDLPPYTIASGPLFYNVTLSVNPMGIYVYRLSDNKVVFNLSPNLFFAYNDQDLLFTNNLGYNVDVLGFGERIAPFVIPPGTYTTWSLDQASPIDNGIDQDGNMYSVHPFYMAIDPTDGTAVGGLFYNSNAQQVTINPTNIQFRSTGGIIDFWLFTGPEPSDVVFQYHQLIGFPTLIPYWSLGWHQSRYGYQNVTVLNGILTNYMNFNLPLDGLWSDIDFMGPPAWDFVNYPLTYPTSNMTRLIQSLQVLGKHWIPIVDAGIAQNLGYSTYTTGLSQNVYIMSPYFNNTPSVGVVWPGNATFVDWFNPNATSFWSNQLTTFENNLAFSGLWIDMNEASNFVNGEVDHPPYLINSSTIEWAPGPNDINYKSIDVAALHYGGILEYNAHSLFGYMEAKATNYFFTQVRNVRPFIISRSSFPGHGRYASKWLGDNYSQWNFMAFSITGIFNFGMFGIPMIGADICGFMGNTNEELCSRWMQLGTMYPFSRNHNGINFVSQEPWAFGPTLLTTSNLSIRNKYMLYLYFYTHMTLLSVEGGMFFRPAFFDYPQEINLLYNSTTSFLLGHALIVHPCLWQGITGTESLFPYDNWYNLYTGEYVFLDYDNMAYLEMPLPGLINIHVKTGKIVPTLDSYTTALDSGDTRMSNISLIITQSGSFDAYGQILLDDGLTNENLALNQYTQVLYEFYSFNNTFDILNINPLFNGYTRQPGEWPYISTLIFYGCTAAPQAVYYANSAGTNLIHANVYWNANDAICKIWLKGYVQPDQPATLFIDYYI